MHSWIIRFLLLALVMAGCRTGDTTSTPDEPSTSPPAVIPSTTTVIPSTTTVPLSTLTWIRVPHDRAVFGGEGDQVMYTVTAGGPGLVAVGNDFSGDESVAAVWTSPDGITWTRVQDEAVLGGEFLQMLGVTAGGPGLVAVGTNQVGGDSNAAVWTSPDGITWTRVQDEAVFAAEGWLEVLGVTVGGPGLVAVGLREFLRDNLYAAVWASTDGITWTKAPDDEAFLSGEGARRLMASVTAGGPGLVAVGNETSVDLDAAVWTSPDGITWSRVPHDETVFGGEGAQVMASVTVGGPGLVAVGSDFSGGDKDAAVWTSTDGITWTRVPHDEAVLGGGGFQEMTSVTAGGPGLVAVGTESVGDSVAAVWTSTDGITWTRVPHDDTVFGGEGDQKMSSVTVGGPGLVAVGIDETDAAVWVAALP